MGLQTGQILNKRYRIVKLLGQGGFGAVYRAWDLNMESPCAVKESFDTSPEAVRQFKREASLLHKLRHPNLPLVYDYFYIKDLGQYLVMDYVDGEDLQQMLDRQGGPLPESEVLPWIDQVCQALGYLHSQVPPVIHRDIKPANIKITPQGKAMLVDFGIAKVFDPHLRTTVGARAITPGYSPAEQYGQGKTDQRADIYALGATLYTLLTGLIPQESVQRMISDALIPAQQVNPAVSVNILHTIRQAMALDPAARFQAIGEFRTALRTTRPVIGSASPVQTGTMPYAGAALYPAGTEPVPLPGSLNQRLKRWIPWLGGSGFVVVILFLLFNGLGGILKPQPTETSTATLASATELATNLPTPAETETPVPSQTFTPVPSPTIALEDTPQPSDTSSPTEVPATLISEKDGMVMVYIPAGEFEMGGSLKDIYDQCYRLDEPFFTPGPGDIACDGKYVGHEPVHTVYLDGYYIDKYEVSTDQYSKCVTTGVCGAPREPEGTQWYGNQRYLNYPVIYVDWFQADAYCRWRGGRLPTEAEWEKAARGTDGWIFPWGNSWPDSGTQIPLNFCDRLCLGDDKNKDYEDGYAFIAPVDVYPPNSYGLYNMLGNVWEWVSDYFSPTYYQSSPVENPSGPESGERRVVRGGSWRSLSSNVRADNRHSWVPEYIDQNNTGFRCVMDIGQ